MTEPLPPAGPPARDRREEVVEERVWYQEPVWIAVVLAFVVLLVLVVALVGMLRAPGEPDTVVLEPAPDEQVDAEPELDVEVEVEPTPTPVTTPTPTPTPFPAFTPAPGVEEEESPEPQHAAGLGSATVQVEHEGGLAVVRMRHEGESFTLQVTDEDGETVEDFEVTASGQYEGSRALGLPPGGYALEVTADGAWALSFEQPRYVAGQALPVTVEGRNDTATGPFQTAGGAVRLTWDADLAIRVLDADGEVVAEVHETGRDATVELDAGLYLLDVQGRDVWRIQVS